MSNHLRTLFFNKFIHTTILQSTCYVPGTGTGTGTSDVTCAVFREFLLMCVWGEGGHHESRVQRHHSVWNPEHYKAHKCSQPRPRGSEKGFPRGKYIQTRQQKRFSGWWEGAITGVWMLTLKDRRQDGQHQEVSVCH